MIARALAAALAVASLGFTASAPAQHSPGLGQSSTVEARFLLLKDVLIDNIGTSDTVIMFHVGLIGDAGHLRLRMMVRYVTPAGKVRVQGDRLMLIVEQLTSAGTFALREDPAWRTATLVIDHGKPTLTMRDTSNYDATKPFEENLAAETARVFPGLPIEPYKPGS